MSLKDKIAINIYIYRSEAGMAILSFAFGYWVYQKSDAVLFVSPRSLEILAVILIMTGIFRFVGIYVNSYSIREWSSNISVLSWTVFLSISLYTGSSLWVIFLALLLDSILVRASQQIGRQIGEF